MPRESLILFEHITQMSACINPHHASILRNPVLYYGTSSDLSYADLLAGIAGYDLNDLYSLDPLAQNLSWTNLTHVVRGQQPSSRAYHGFVCEGRRLYVFAGQSIRMGESLKDVCTGISWYFKEGAIGL